MSASGLRRTSIRAAAGIAGLALLISAEPLTTVPAEAATIVVGSASDRVADDGQCGIREAVLSANTDSGNDDCTRGGGADVIVLGASTYNLSGGELLVRGNLTIEGNGVTISSSTRNRIFTVAAGATLTLNNLTVTGGEERLGGGIFNEGALNLNNITVSDNTASESGGGLHNEGTVTVRDSKFLRNSATGLDGGGIHSNEGRIDIYSSMFADNSAERNGGGIGTRFTDVTMHPGNRIVRNTAGFSGGGFSNILGHYEVTRTTIGGSAADGNRAEYGGGVDTAGSNYTATLVLRESTVSYNVAEFEGGGFYTFEDTVVIANSLIAHNSAGVEGGAIFNDTNALTITNSTISGNEAGTNGGAIFGFDDRVLELYNVTVTANTAQRGGGIDSREGLPPLLVNTIISGNSGGDCAGPVDSDSKRNLAGASCDLDANNIASANPGLAPLADNGGPTLTHALLAGSPAINAGDMPVCTSITNSFDQRGAGFARIVDRGCDIGAFEANNPAAGAATTPGIYQPQTRPNVGGAVEHLFLPRPSGQAAAAPATTAAQTTGAGSAAGSLPIVRPPSTGDGGLQ